MLQEKLKGLAQVAGPDANRINAAHAAKSQRAREEKVPELIIAALQKLVREIGSSQSAFQTGVEAQVDTEIRQGANRELFQALQSDLDAFTRHLAAAIGSIEHEARADSSNAFGTHAAVACRTACHSGGRVPDHHRSIRRTRRTRRRAAGAADRARERAICRE